jgi:hypothetical protein
MRWADIAVDGATWSIPGEAREKGDAKELVLPTLALEIIAAQPRLRDNDFVLAGRGGGHINGFSKAKRALQHDERHRQNQDCELQQQADRQCQLLATKAMLDVWERLGLPLRCRALAAE